MRKRPVTRLLLLLLVTAIGWAAVPLRPLRLPLRKQKLCRQTHWRWKLWTFPMKAKM